MSRRVFFSFHFDDSFRANQVRMANVVGGTEAAGFYDHSLYEETKRGVEAIRREILEQLEGTSVTVALIGADTASRSWVDFEIRESIRRDNGLLGITIHNLSGPPWPGAPPLLWGPSRPGRLPDALPTGTPVYVWDSKNREGFARVIEEAAQRGERLRATKAKIEGQRRAIRAMRPPSPPGGLQRPGIASPLEQAIRTLEAERIARLLEPPPPLAPQSAAPASLEQILRAYRLRRILGGDKT
jgi:hypothetical protein